MFPYKITLQIKQESPTWKVVFPELQKDPLLNRSIASSTKKVFAALITWIPNLVRASLPLEFMSTVKAGTNEPNMMQHVNRVEVWAEMAQWSDVLIFDLLLGNQDRLKHIPVRTIKKGLSFTMSLDFSYIFFKVKRA